jgi:phosphoserine phosphatase RsbU/P
MEPKKQKHFDRDEQIYQLTTLVAGRFSLQQVLDRLAEAAVRIIGVKACSIRLLDEDAGDLKMRSTYGLSEEYRNKGVVRKDDPVIRAAFAGHAIVIDDMRTDRRVRFKQATVKEGLVSQLTVAMVFRNKPIGALRLYSPTPKHFNKADIAIARVVASQCAVAITNARLYSEAIEGARIAEQMRVAGIIQRRMIPQKAPSVPGFDIAATYIPCFDIGGDFYDFLPLKDGRLAVAIADVMGKGIPAAIMMSSFRGNMRAYVDSSEGQPSIVDIVTKLNKMACRECIDGEFITLLCAIIDHKKQTVTYCNCGHEPAILIRDGQAKELPGGGLVLGVDSNAKYEIETVQLKPEDCLMFFTDGLADAINFNGEFWARERMLETARKFCGGSAEQMINNILAYRRRFVGLAPQLDDTSVIVVKALAKQFL